MRALIFDFDGVIADSEALANTVLAELVSERGRSTTLDEALTRYSGRRWHEVIAEIEKDISSSLPPTFSDDLKALTLERFRTDLIEVKGAADFVRKFSAVPHCIASSSSTDRLAICLSILKLEHEFQDFVFSADLVQRGKPHPDIFLLAAARLGVEPSDCLVIEDSAGGVMAAVAAGMTSIGLCAGSHIREGHGPKLKEAGAVYLASSWDEVDVIASELFDQVI